MADRDPNPDFADLLRAFVDADVRFLIVGAYALGAHGHVRATGDLDVPRKHFRIRTARLVVALAAFSSVALAGRAAADLSCTPRYGGGYQCHDGAGTWTTITPRYGGGFDAYDNHGNHSTTTPRYGGGTQTYDSRGNWWTTTPRYGGGSQTYDDHGNWWTTTPRYGGGSTTHDGRGNWTTCTPRYGGGFDCR